MKLALITFLLIAGLAPVAFASPEAELKALEQQWSDAYKKGDTAVLKAVEAEEWILVDPEGTTTTKAQDIKELGDKTFVVKESTNSDVKVRMLGDNHAALTGSVKMSGSYKGKDFEGEYRFLDLFEKKDGKWQAILSRSPRSKKKRSNAFAVAPLAFGPRSKLRAESYRQFAFVSSALAGFAFTSYASLLPSRRENRAARRGRLRFTP